MAPSLDLGALVHDVQAVLHGHGLTIDYVGLTLDLQDETFDTIAADHPGHHPDVVSIANGNEWCITFMRHRPRQVGDIAALAPGET